MTEKTPKEKTISTQYAELNRFAANGEFERALKAANKILGVAPQEALAFHCKIVCLIQLSKFEECISLINKNPHFSSDLIFEKAYCHYRVNQHEEALAIIDHAKDIDFRLKELKAQILYRLEDFKGAVEHYEDIIQNVEDDYEDERKTNLSAALVYLNEPYDKKIRISENTYELCYNKACMLISQGLYADAEKKLKQCEKLCREALEEDEATEEEIDIDLALIRVQLAFVCQKQGRIKEAHQLYAANLKIKLEDVALVAVASNNAACLNKDQNLFDSKKKMKAAQNSALVNKLPSLQRKYIALNNAIFHYYINQPEQCEKACASIDETWPELSLYTTILRALILWKANKENEVINLLKSFKTNKRSDKLYINLCIAQLYLMQGEKLKACKVLENLGDDTYKPGIVGALTTLYLGLENEDTALKLFERTVEWYRKNKVKEVDLTNIWRQAAEFHIKNGHPQVAANSLEELLRTDKNDKKVIAQLVLAYSQFNKEGALKWAKQLPSIEELSVGVDIESLQTTASSAFTVKKTPTVKQDSQPGTPKSDGLIDKKHKNKKHKKRLPKNYNPNIAPDPERWLPKYERSTYTHRRRYRKTKDKDVIKGSQGTASGQADQYDFSKHVEQQEQAETGSPIVEPSPKVKNQHAKKSQKKKGKRR